MEVFRRSLYLTRQGYLRGTNAVDTYDRREVSLSQKLVTEETESGPVFDLYLVELPPRNEAAGGRFPRLVVR